MNRLPAWFRQELPGEEALKTVSLVAQSAVNTVCCQARCPNSSLCFKEGKLTFMILGDTCTRNCRFCSVNKKAFGVELEVDADEPARIAGLVRQLGLQYAVITSVTRDDLIDGGASQFVKTVKAIKGLGQEMRVELLVPDFKGNLFFSLKAILDTSPDVVGHNIETVARLYSGLRPEADYRLSLDVLSNIKVLNRDVLSKSSIMLGLGETEDEVVRTMRDLRKSNCDILTLGQYLAPSDKQAAVKEFISLEQFARYKEIGEALGFLAVMSGPLVRSSYRAEELFDSANQDWVL